MSQTHEEVHKTGFSLIAYCLSTFLIRKQRGSSCVIGSDKLSLCEKKLNQGEKATGLHTQELIESRANVLETSLDLD